ncbi:uncharacterized protein LOC144123379 [Amblyomma americanum]
MDLQPPETRPTEAQCFNFNLPVPVPEDDLIDAIEEVVGVGGLQYLQPLGGTKFLAAVSSMAQATKMLAAGSLLVAGHQVPLVQLAAPVVFVKVRRLPPSVSNDALAAALSPFGKVREVTEPVFKSRSHVRSGTRLVKLDMQGAPPNFITVAGHRAVLEYRGMRKVRARCGAKGHLRATCTATRCGRCAAYGHEADSCHAACMRCGENQVTSDFIAPRSYAAALEAPGSTPQAPLEATPAPRQDEVDNTTSDTPETDEAEQPFAVEVSKDLTSSDALSDLENLEAALFHAQPTPAQEQQCGTETESATPEVVPQDPRLVNPISQVADLC